MRRQDGFTLIEIALYAATFAIVGVPFVSTVLVATRSMAEGDMVNRIAERNRTILLRLRQDIRTAIAGEIAVGPDGSSLTMVLPEGFDDLGIIPGETILFEFAPAADESLNGADDNGNGLTDEGILLRRNVSTADEIPIANGLNLAKCGFSTSGSAVTLTVANFGRVRQSGNVYELSRSTIVNPRN